MTALARNTDPATSHDAARSVREYRSAQVRKVVANLFRDYGPMTDEELGHRYDGLPGGPGVSPSGLRTRRSELVTEGRVVDTGERRRTESGRSAIVWALA